MQVFEPPFWAVAGPGSHLVVLWGTMKPRHSRMFPIVNWNKLHAVFRCSCTWSWFWNWRPPSPQHHWEAPPTVANVDDEDVSPEIYLGARSPAPGLWRENSGIQNLKHATAMLENRGVMSYGPILKDVPQPCHIFGVSLTPCWGHGNVGVARSREVLQRSSRLWFPRLHRDSGLLRTWCLHAKGWSRVMHLRKLSRP